MKKVKKGCVEIHWKHGRADGEPLHQHPIEITLVKADTWECLGSGFALSLRKKSSGDKRKCKARAVRLPPVRHHVRDPIIDWRKVNSLLNKSPLHRNITEKRYSYVEGLVESIQLQPRRRNAFCVDRGRYQLKIRRAETDVRLDWSDRVEVWPGVMDLVYALEEIYLRLIEKCPAVAGDPSSLPYSVFAYEARGTV